jgi:dephospho-CoA kinase
MLKLGITGGIGSGKSTVCDIFKQLGVPVYNADERAKALVDTNSEIKLKIIAEFGEDSFINNIYNRSYIASIVFNDPLKLSVLNSIIHPAVLKDWEDYCKIHKDKKYIVKEAAIMLETDSKNSIDRIVLVYAPLVLRKMRLKHRNPNNYKEILKRIESQMPDEEKMELADDVIFNDEYHSLIEQVLKIHSELMK